jgi:hypothetical protein
MASLEINGHGKSKESQMGICGRNYTLGLESRHDVYANHAAPVITSLATIHINTVMSP